MRASWIDGAVAEFGRHFGFEHFALNDRDVAAARFLNGAALALEYARESLCLQVRVPMHADGASVRKLLVAAHPGNRFPYPLRTAYLAKTGQALFLVKFPERDVTETALWQVFSEMWALAARFGGGTSWS
jgi:type III secretion system chaperone SycN